MKKILLLVVFISTILMFTNCGIGIGFPLGPGGIPGVWVLGGGIPGVWMAGERTAVEYPPTITLGTVVNGEFIGTYNSGEGHMGSIEGMYNSLTGAISMFFSYEGYQYSPEEENFSTSRANRLPINWMTLTGNAMTSGTGGTWNTYPPATTASGTWSAEK